MREFILLLTDIVNLFHDLLVRFASMLGFDLSDKELHFWIIGIIGLMGFIVVDFVFRYLAKWSITAVSFIYSLTLVLVFVFAVEIQQKVTGRGQMEFHDAVMGVAGFTAFFTTYIVLKLLFLWIRNKYNKRRRYFY
ncbi:MAG: hypothetical protein H0Z32_05485 [Bacillaceae bacterium]|nr:hypothetical protein [Bacillaceae bacterium]